MPVQLQNVPAVGRLETRILGGAECVAGLAQVNRQPAMFAEHETHRRAAYHASPWIEEVQRKAPWPRRLLGVRNRQTDFSRCIHEQALLAREGALTVEHRLARP